MNILFATVNHNDGELEILSSEFRKIGINVCAAVGHTGLRAKFEKYFPNTPFYPFFKKKGVGDWTETLEWSDYVDLLESNWHTILPLADRHPPYEGGTSSAIVRSAIEFSVACDILNRHPVDALVFFKEPERLLELFLYKIAKKRGIDVHLTRPGIVPASAFFSDSYDAPFDPFGKHDPSRCSPVAKVADTNVNHRDANHDKNLIEMAVTSESNEYTPDYMKNQNILSKPSDYLKLLFQRKQTYALIRNSLRISSGPLFRLRLLHRYRKSSDKLHVIEEKIKQSNLSVFFPLHYQPEQTTMPLGGVATHQILMIKLLSQRLPEGAIIVVKEHPSTFKADSTASINFRHYEYYRDLLTIKNCFLASLDVPSLALQRQCDITATIRGTATFEAALAGRRGLVFGNSPYRDLPGVLNFFEADANTWNLFVSGEADYSSTALNSSTCRAERETLFRNYKMMAFDRSSICAKRREIWDDDFKACRGEALIAGLADVVDKMGG